MSILLPQVFSNMYNVYDIDTLKAILRVRVDAAENFINALHSQDDMIKYYDIVRYIGHVQPSIFPSDLSIALNPLLTDVKKIELIEKIKNNLPTSLYFQNAMPYIASPPTVDLSSDPDIIEKIMNYLRYKTLDKWLWDEENLKSILGYFVIKDGKVEYIAKIEDKKKHPLDGKEEIEKKIKFIEHELLSKKRMYKILNKVMSDTGAKWVELPKIETVVKDYIKKFLKQRIKKNIGYKQPIVENKS